MNVLIKTLASRLARQLLVSSIVFAASMALMAVSMELGVLTLMLYSTFVVVKSSRRELPLSVFTALIPGGLALACFLFMLLFVGVFRVYMPICGILLGILPGVLMSRGHRIYAKQGRLYAKRTSLYILVWALSMLLTQISTLLYSSWFIDFSFLVSGFTTTMAVMLSLSLYARARTLGAPKSPFSPLIPLLLLAFSFTLAIATPHASAFNVGDPANDPQQLVKAGQYVFDQEKGALMGSGIRTEENSAHNLKDGNTYTLKHLLVPNRNNYGVCNFGLSNVRMDPAKLGDAAFQQFLRVTDDVYQSKAAKYSGGTYRSLKGSLGNDGEGKYYFMPENREGGDGLSILAIWRYGDWILTAGYVGIPSGSAGLIGQDPVAWLEGTLGRTMSRVKHLPNSSAPSLAPAPPTPQPDEYEQWSSETTAEDTSSHDPLDATAEDEASQDVSASDDTGQYEQEYGAGETDIMDDLVDALEEVLMAFQDALQGHHGFREGAVAAGLAVALVQLLSGAGISAAYVAAAEAAAAVEYAAVDATGSMVADATADQATSEQTDPSDEPPSEEAAPGEISPEQIPPDTTREQEAAMRNRVQKVISQKQTDGYYVRNREFNVAPVVDQTLWAVHKSVNNLGTLIGWHPVDDAAGLTGGQCGEYGEWGGEWSKKDCEEIFGEGTVMTQITAESPANSNINHNATRVITPSGDRYVLDYWQGMQNKKAFYKEDEWVAQQALEGRSEVVRSYNGGRAETYRGGDEGMFNTLVKKYGEEEGARRYLEHADDQNLARRRAIVLSYRKSPWPLP